MTVQTHSYSRSDDGTWKRLIQLRLTAWREKTGWEAGPAAGVIDIQSMKTTESGGPRGYDAGKKLKERKRHIVTDTAAPRSALSVTSAIP